MLARPTRSRWESALWAGRIEKVVQELGRGGMGVVFEAIQTKVSDRRVASKVLGMQYAADPQYRKRFEREASSALGEAQPGTVRAIPAVSGEEGPLDGPGSVDLPDDGTTRLYWQSNSCLCAGVIQAPDDTVAASQF